MGFAPGTCSYQSYNSGKVNPFNTSFWLFFKIKILLFHLPNFKAGLQKGRNDKPFLNVCESPLKWQHTTKMTSSVFRVSCIHTSSPPSWFLNTILHQQKPGLLRKMIDFRFGARKIQGNPRISCARKHRVLKDQQDHFKRMKTPTGQ